MQNRKFTNSAADIKSLRMVYKPELNDFGEAPPPSLFLRGPIPLDWLGKAAGLPGKTINVALAICWLYGMWPDKEIKLNREALKHFRVGRDAATDSLKRLQEAGLVRLHPRTGGRPVIEILGFSMRKIPASRP